MWYELSSKEKEENIHVMKIYLLSPFLFGQVKSNQDDKVNCGIRNTIASQNTTWIQGGWMAWLVLQLLSLNCLLLCSENLLFHLWLLAALAFVMFSIPWRVLIIIIPDLCQPVCKIIYFVCSLKLIKPLEVRPNWPFFQWRVSLARATSLFSRIDVLCLQAGQLVLFTKLNGNCCIRKSKIADPLLLSTQLVHLVLHFLSLFPAHSEFSEWASAVVCLDCFGF